MSRPISTGSQQGCPSQTPEPVHPQCHLQVHPQPATRQNPRRHRFGRVPGRRLRDLTLITSGLAAVLLLSGCSTQWASMSPSISRSQATTDTVATTSSAVPASTASTTGTSTTGTSDGSATSSASAAPTDPFTGGELADGSVQHIRATGDADLVIRYWTEGTGTAVRLSALLRGTDRRHAVKVTGFTATGRTADGSDRVLVDDQGEFVLTPPYSYTSALALPTQGTPVASIVVRFDLLVETEPGSGAFYRQTVLDTVALGPADAGQGATS